MKIAPLALVCLISCQNKPAPPPAAAAPADAPAPAVATAAPAPAAAAEPVAERPLTARPGGPSLEACQKAATHLGALVEDSALAPTPEQRSYLEHVLARDHERVVRYCLEVTVPKEVDCLLAAKVVDATVDCARFRQELPADIADSTHKDPTLADCERFFDRLRGFQIDEGAGVEALDRDRDQIVRTCQEKAKVGTIACFIASPSYAQARRCP